MAPPLSAFDISRVSVSITGPGIPDPIAQDLQQTAGEWEGVFGMIPAGANRVFTAEAFDSADNTLYAGETDNATISPDTTALVIILLQQANPPEPESNAVPVINSLIVSSTIVPPLQSISLTVAAHDPDSNDTLTYTWTAPSGTFDNPSSANVTWTAPETIGSVTLNISVTDSHSASNGLNIPITVMDAEDGGEANVIATFNTWPAVTVPTATPGQVEPGETTDLAVDCNTPLG